MELIADTTNIIFSFGHKKKNQSQRRLACVYKFGGSRVIAQYWKIKRKEVYKITKIIKCGDSTLFILANCLTKEEMAYIAISNIQRHFFTELRFYDSGYSRKAY